ncbi:MAG: ankyrin repeat domain-containing protein [Simkaniaceae bacterium]|nr:ankyrin repeat domain-containing protein [Simkaniaceae bacterium]
MIRPPSIFSTLLTVPEDDLLSPVAGPKAERIEKIVATIKMNDDPEEAISLANKLVENLGVGCISDLLAALGANVYAPCSIRELAYFEPAFFGLNANKLILFKKVAEAFATQTEISSHFGQSQFEIIEELIVKKSRTAVRFIQSILTSALLTNENWLIDAILALEGIEAVLEKHYYPLLESAATNNHHELIPKLAKGRKLTGLFAPFTPMQAAISTRSFESLQVLVKLAEGAPEVLQEIGESIPTTPLIEAVNIEDARMVELLLDGGADPNQIVNGTTAFLIACREGTKEIVETLLPRADLSISDYLGNSPAHYASERGEILSVMPEEMDVNCPNRHGKRPVHIAIEKGLLDCVIELQRRGALFDFPGTLTAPPAVCHAVMCGHEAIVAHLVTFCPMQGVMSDEGEELLPMHLAIQHRFLKFICYLGDPNEKGAHSMSPLEFAADRGDKFACIKLVESGAEIGRGFELHYACQAQHTIIVRYLVYKGYPLDKKDGFGKDFGILVNECYGPDHPEFEELSKIGRRDSHSE